MTSLRHLAVIAAGLVALGGCAKTPPPAPAPAPVVDTAADEAAVRAVNPAWFAAHTAGDADAVAALYADDAVLSIPGVPPVRGRAAIREAIAADIAAMKAAGLGNQPGPAPEFGLSGDMAWEWSTFTVTDASGATVDTGKYVTVYARKDGQWLIVRDIWNSDAPPAGAAAEPATPTG
jgi:uncharacterized protein (TIGR02246 family)